MAAVLWLQSTIFRCMPHHSPRLLSCLSQVCKRDSCSKHQLGPRHPLQLQVWLIIFPPLLVGEPSKDVRASVLPQNMVDPL